MSYDVSLVVEVDGNPIEVADRNHTSNTAPMWREAGCDIAEFHLRGAREFGHALYAAIDDIEFRRDHYVEMNPPNGWGSVDTTLEFLRDLYRACAKFPSAQVQVCR